MTSKTKKDILNDEDFKQMASTKNSISLVLTVIELVVYFGFIALIAFNKEFLAQDLSGSITYGIPIGIGVIVFSWLVTGIYVQWANGSYDDMVEKVKAKIGD
ncbi:MAG: DUF485 domain-containing protein [Nitrospirae bacterium]|nr:DUF485 domain-containing protein [Nitrospirota bacterium]